MITVISVSQGQRIEDEIIPPRDRSTLRQREYVKRYAELLYNEVEVRIKSLTITH